MEQIEYTTALPLNFAIERPERKLEKRPRTAAGVIRPAHNAPKRQDHDHAPSRLQHQRAAHRFSKR
jgi:hypothetical protein